MKTRFSALIRVLGFKKDGDFTDALGIHRTYLSQIYRKGLNPRFVRRLLEKFPRVNINYLETGAGEPLLPEGAFDPSDIERAGQIKLILSILDQLDPPTLKVILDAIEKFKNSPHYRRITPADEAPDPGDSGPKKK